MKNILLILLISVSASLFGQDQDCSKFKNGNYKIATEETGTTIISRKGSKQIEYSEESKLKILFKVKWINDCTYTLTVKRILENPNNVSVMTQMIVTVQIIEVYKNSYLQKSTANISDVVFVSEVVRTD